MTEQSSTRSPIRELAWRYYQGEIGAREYRELRRRQIDAMTGQRTVPDSESRAGGSQTAILILAVGVIVLAGALALWWFLLRGGDSPGHRLSANDLIPVIASSGALGAVGQRLAANGWDDGAAANFLRQWSQADANIRRIAQTESWYNPLNQIVEDRIDESMALQAAGGDIGPREEFLLSALADALSLPAPEWSDIPAKDTFDTASGLIAREAWPEALPFVDSAEFSTAEPSWQPNPVEQHSATSADPPTHTPETTPSRLDEPSRYPAETAGGGDILSATTTPTTSGDAAASNSDRKPKPGNDAGVAPAVKLAAVLREPTQSQPATDENAGSAQASPAEKPTAQRRGGCQAGLAQTRRPYCRDYLSQTQRGPRMVVLSGGEFVMGSNMDASEQPPTPVTIGYPLAISMYEISHAEFVLYCQTEGTRCPDNPWQELQAPVVNVSWQEAVAFANWLATTTGKNYRLPSEAEWEYATRAGETGRYPFGDNILVSQARFSRNGQAETSPLPTAYRSINANGFGLYHMVGNVREWVLDAWQDHHDKTIAQGAPRPGATNSARVVRGGSYADSAWALRSAARVKLAADTADTFTGFRVALDFSSK